MRLGEAPDKSLLDPIETASRDEIAALQTRRLSVTLRRVYDDVPAMRAKFDQHGVHPDDFRALEDLRRFPFTAKSDLRANYPFGLLAVPKDQLARDSRVLRHDRQADGGRLYAQRSLDVERYGRADDPRRRRPRRA